jgi:ribose transport system ATP-binding protein
MAFLNAQGIKKSFGPVEVLHGLDFEVDGGSVVALLGENGAGKSTFVRILAGDHHPDAGEIRIEGEVVRLHNVADSRRRGIKLIAQEIADAPTLTVAENIALGAWPVSGGVLSRRRMRNQARDVLRELGSDIDVNQRVERLRLGERQLVEIARAVAGQSRCLIFDEPTAALSDVEARQLFQLIERLRQQGVAIIYITHRLDEVFRIADRVSVLRDGVVSLDAAVADVDTPTVVTAMVGRGVEAARHVSATPVPDTAEPVLAVEGLCAEDFSEISFDVPAGKVLGLYGKIGSGVTELAETLFGARPSTAGQIRINSQPVTLHGPADAIRYGIGFLPPDRKEQAVLTGRSLAENVSAPSWGRLSHAGVITAKTEGQAYRRWHDVLSIRSRNDPRQLIGTLSGGNQQKVLLARWLECRSKVLILVEPTRGVDVGARQEIYQAIRRLAEGGSAVILASSDYEDPVAVADETLVLVRGRVTDRHVGDAITVPNLTTSAGGAVHA